MPKQIVVKSNALINASYRFTLTEMRLILYGISLINPLRHEFPLSYRIDIAKFAQLFKLERHNIYTDLKEVTLKTFWERDFSYINEKGKTVIVRWLTSITYEDKSGYLELTFNEKLKPFLHQLKTNFTSYDIEQISRFNSLYSTRIYEMCTMQYNKKKSDNTSSDTKSIMFTIPIIELKEILAINDLYSRFFDFKNRVLERAKIEITKKSDLNLNYSIIKDGRVPKGILFKLTKKK